ITTESSTVPPMKAKSGVQRFSFTLVVPAASVSLSSRYDTEEKEKGKATRTGVINTVGDMKANQPRVIRCYNCEDKVQSWLFIGGNLELIIVMRNIIALLRLAIGSSFGRNDVTTNPGSSCIDDGAENILLLHHSTQDRERESERAKGREGEREIMLHNVSPPISLPTNLLFIGEGRFCCIGEAVLVVELLMRDTLAAGTTTGQVVFYDVRAKERPLTVL
nr:hypothetical protein [Tanacetum cinerariifolium]